MNKEDYIKLAELTEVSDLYKSLTCFTLKCSAKEVEEINKTLCIIYNRFMELSKEAKKQENCKQRDLKNIKTNEL